MVEPSDVDFEERDEFMVSFTNENPVFRTAHFLKPSVSKNLCKKPTISGQKGSEVNVHFRGWRYPKKEWISWVERMQTRHQLTWKKAGIHEAIIGSVYIIKRERDFVLGLAEKWCPETNTFIFPWGEATLTLEDMKVLGGFSVLGDSVLTRLDDQESVEIEKKLIQKTKEAVTSGSSTATGFSWLNHFMGSGSNLEHEAFLSLWLSWYVFPTDYSRVGKHAFPIAIRLARGTRIALAPAVLSRLYEKLRFLKEKLSASKELIWKDKWIDLYCPFQLVQLWGWERFPILGPEPMSLTDTSKPRRARWHNQSTMPIFNFSMAIDSAGDSFQWRPYALSSDYWLSNKFNLEKEQWVLVDKDLEEELETLVRCLRVSELVGLNCIEQYLPHRVSKQFGMDQDVPLPVARCNRTTAAAWNNYNRPIRDGKLYIPARHFDSGVTLHYLKWWNQPMMKQGNDVIKSHVKRPRNTLRRRRRIGAEIEDRLPAESIQKCCFQGLRIIELEPSATRGQQRTQESVAKHDDTGKGFELPNSAEPLSGSRHQNTSISAADLFGTSRAVVDPMPSVSKTTLCADDVSHEVENMSTRVIDLTNEENGAEIQVLREIPGLKLEARIQRLERILKYIKKARYPHLCKAK